MRTAATQASNAAQDFARAANGNNGHIIPAATAYDLLGNIKALLRNVEEVTDYMPRGVTQRPSHRNIRPQPLHRRRTGTG